MRLTRRGRVAGLVVALAIVMGWQFGARSLNAVAAPLGAALLVGIVSVARSDPPTVTLFDPEPGVPGEIRTVTGSVEGSGIVTVELHLPAGVAGAAAETRVSGSVERELELTDRGVYTVGPATVRYRDPLGLVEQQVDTRETARIVVHPEYYEVSLSRVLGAVLSDEAQTERQSFDRLREYEPGDPLRNVHWKTSAKHDEFHVVEFDPTERPETVTIAAAAMRGRADEMAAATASIARASLDAGLDVEIAAPEEYLPPGQGDTHWQNILGLLARVESGSPTEDSVEAADIGIRAVSERTAVRTAGGDTTFTELRDQSERQWTRDRDRETNREVSA